MSISEKPLRFLKPNESKANYPLERELRLEEILGYSGFLLNNYGAKSLETHCPSNVTIN